VSQQRFQRPADARRPPGRLRRHPGIAQGHATEERPRPEPCRPRLLAARYAAPSSPGSRLSARALSRLRRRSRARRFRPLVRAPEPGWRKAGRAAFVKLSYVLRRDWPAGPKR
jgi:hypothetical protein